MNRLSKRVVVLLFTAILIAGSLFMIGPQVMIIVPVVIVAGIILSIRRSFLSLVCFGYPLTFGLLSALIGYVEQSGYERTSAFAVSVGIGVVGSGLIAAGLWKALPDRAARATSELAEPEH